MSWFHSHPLADVVVLTLSLLVLLLVMGVSGWRLLG